TRPPSRFRLGGFKTKRASSLKSELGHPLAWRESGCAGERHLLVLVDAVAAHADAANELTVLVERDPARERDDPVAKLLASTNPDLIGIPNSPEGAAGLRHVADDSAREGVLIAREERRGARFRDRDVDRADPRIGHREQPKELAVATDDGDLHLRGMHARRGAE